jgi:arabinose-5-phosphate isomerase
MRATIEREAEVLRGIAAALDDSSAAAVDIVLATKGHVFIGGAGTSNYIASRFAHLLSCSGKPAVFLHPADSLHGSSGAVRPEDTVILISKGGKTVEVNRFAAIVKERGAKLIAFTENPESELGRLADAVVKVKIPADSDPFGMVATSSSLANGSVADAICETVLVESGYTKEAFGKTHPGGAVGDRIRTEATNL